jgi:carbonic anhydrase
MLFGDDNKLGGYKSKHNYMTRHTSDSWKASSLEWHSKSEHTVQGIQFDLEMQLTHTKQN